MDMPIELADEVYFGQFPLERRFLLTFQVLALHTHVLTILHNSIFRSHFDRKLLLIDLDQIVTAF